MDSSRRSGAGFDFAGALHVGSMKGTFIPNLHTAHVRHESAHNKIKAAC